MVDKSNNNSSYKTYSSSKHHPSLYQQIESSLNHLVTLENRYVNLKTTEKETNDQLLYLESKISSSQDGKVSLESDENSLLSILRLQRNRLVRDLQKEKDHLKINQQSLFETSISKNQLSFRILEKTPQKNKIQSSRELGSLKNKNSTKNGSSVPAMGLNQLSENIKNEKIKIQRNIDKLKDLMTLINEKESRMSYQKTIKSINQNPKIIKEEKYIKSNLPSIFKTSKMKNVTFKSLMTKNTLKSPFKNNKKNYPKYSASNSSSKIDTSTKKRRNMSLRDSQLNILKTGRFNSQRTHSNQRNYQEKNRTSSTARKVKLENIKSTFIEASNDSNTNIRNNPIQMEVRLPIRVYRNQKKVDFSTIRIDRPKVYFKTTQVRTTGADDALNIDRKEVELANLKSELEHLKAQIKNGPSVRLHRKSKKRSKGSRRVEIQRGEEGDADGDEESRENGSVAPKKNKAKKYVRYAILEAGKKKNTQGDGYLQSKSSLGNPKSKKLSNRISKDKKSKKSLFKDDAQKPSTTPTPNNRVVPLKTGPEAPPPPRPSRNNSPPKILKQQSPTRINLFIRDNQSIKSSNHLISQNSVSLSQISELNSPSNKRNQHLLTDWGKFFIENEEEKRADKQIEDIHHDHDYNEYIKYYPSEAKTKRQKTTNFNVSFVDESSPVTFNRSRVDTVSLINYLTK